MTDCHFLLDTLGLRVGTGLLVPPHHMQWWYLGLADHDAAYKARGEYSDPRITSDDHDGGHTPSCGL